MFTSTMLSNRGPRELFGGYGSSGVLHPTHTLGARSERTDPMLISRTRLPVDESRRHTPTGSLTVSGMVSRYTYLPSKSSTCQPVAVGGVPTFSRRSLPVATDTMWTKSPPAPASG